MKRAYIKIVLLAVMITTLISCDPYSDWDLPGGNPCYVEKPEFGQIIIRVTLNDTISEVPVSIYRGKTDQNEVLLQDTLRQEIVYFDAPVNERYAVEARYFSSNQEIIAVDGGRLYIYEDTENCDVGRWRIHDLKIDCALSQ